MASGATISLTGGTTMTQVVAGVDTVQATDFNNARTNVDAMLGTATDVALGSFTAANTYGYTQSGAGVSAAVIGELIYADNAVGGFKRLQDDVQSLSAFLGQTLRTGVGTDVTTSDTITASTWNNLMLNIKDCWDNRFIPASTTASTEDTVTFSNAWGITLEQETTWTWGSESECRAFFNAGGGIGASSTRAGGSLTVPNTAWGDLLSSMGNVFMQHNSTTGTTGSGAGVGFYNLTTGYQLLYTKFGSGAFVNNFFKVEGKVNSVTNPTVIFLKYTWSEQYSSTIDGTVSLNSVLLQPNPNGSTITVIPGVVSAGEISSSGVLSPVYVIAADSDNVDEGNAVTLAVTTTNFGNGVLYWTVLGTGVLPTANSDFTAVSGNVTMVSDVGSFVVTTVADLTTEGAETFVVQLRTDSEIGNVVATSNTITVNDTSLSPTTYSITPDIFSVDEGNSVTVSVITTDFGNGVLYWTANSSGVGAANVAADLANSSGNVTVTADVGSFIITTVADLTTEGPETFFVELRTDSESGNIVATSNVITIVDTSTTAPTFAVTPAANTMNEDANITFTVTTTDFGNGTLYWTTDGVATSDDFVESSGNVLITDNSGTIVITTAADLTTEGPETFFVQLRTDSISGNIVATSSNVTIVDTSTSPTTFVITPTMDEGASIVFNVTTTNFGAGTLYWNIIGTGDNPASNADFVNHNGNLSVINDAGSFTVSTVADLTTEGSETFAVQLRTDGPSGNVVVTSATLSINDTSITPATYAVTANISSVDEGNSVTFNVATTDFGNGVLYWDTIYADSADFDQANGNVVITTNVGSFVVTTVADLTTEGNEIFAVQLRTDGLSGNIVATSGNVTIVDTSLSASTYSVTPEAFSVDEGNSLSLAVLTTNFGNGVLYWTTEGTGTATSDDFVESSGTVIITDDVGLFSILTVADLTTEGAETFYVELRTDSIGGTVVANSNVITIVDTSTTPSTYSITPETLSVDEGNAVTLNVTTTDFGNGVLYWTANSSGVGAANVAADLANSSGNVTVTADVGSFIVTTVADLTTEGNETFFVELRTDSVSGNIVATSNVVTIVDTSTAPAESYRYWRILFDGVAADDSVELSEIEFLDKRYYRRVTTGSVFASSPSTAYLPTDANDGFYGTIGDPPAASGYWQSNTAAQVLAVDNSLIWYIRDAGEGNEFACEGVTLTRANLAVTFTGFDVQYSSDNSSWTTEWTVSNVAPLVNSAFGPVSFTNTNITVFEPTPGFDTANVVLWIKSYDGAFTGNLTGAATNGDAVQTMTNHAAGFAGANVLIKQTVEANRPILRTGGAAGMPYLEFDDTLSQHFETIPYVTPSGTTSHYPGATGILADITDPNIGSQIVYPVLGQAVTGAPRKNNFVYVNDAVGDLFVRAHKNSLTAYANEIDGAQSVVHAWSTFYKNQFIRQETDSTVDWVVDTGSTVYNSSVPTTSELFKTVESTGITHYMRGKVYELILDLGTVAGNIGTDWEKAQFNGYAIQQYLEGRRLYGVPDAIPLEYSIIPTAFNTDEGDSLIFNVSTTDFGNGVLYWAVDHITTANNDFVAVNGNVSISSNSGTFTITTVADEITEGNETFAVQLSGSPSSNILATSGNVTIYDISTAPVDGYRYWRILFDGVASADRVALSEIEFLDKRYYSRVTSGLAFASGDGTTFPPSSAADGRYTYSTTEFWRSNTGATDIWYLKDAGEGNEFACEGVTLTRANLAVTFTGFDVQYSSDNSSWTTEWTVSNVAPLVNSAFGPVSFTNTNLLTFEPTPGFDTANVVLWLKSYDGAFTGNLTGTATDGDPVQTMTNHAAGFAGANVLIKQTTLGNRPILRTGGAAGMPYLEFDNTLAQHFETIPYVTPSGTGSHYPGATGILADITDPADSTLAVYPVLGQAVTDSPRKNNFVYVNDAVGDFFVRAHKNSLTAYANEIDGVHTLVHAWSSFTRNQFIRQETDSTVDWVVDTGSGSYDFDVPTTSELFKTVESSGTTYYMQGKVYELILDLGTVIGNTGTDFHKAQFNGYAIQQYLEGRRIYGTGGFSPITVTRTAGTGATETVPSGATSVRIRVGGGGGGGGVTSAFESTGGGGGEGGFAELTIAVVGGDTLTYTVGAGGAGRPTVGAGTAGGASTVSGTVSGGAVSMTANGGGGGGGIGRTGGAGGTASGGTTNTTGFNGADGAPDSTGLGGSGASTQSGEGGNGGDTNNGSSPGIHGEIEFHYT